MPECLLTGIWTFDYHNADVLAGFIQIADVFKKLIHLITSFSIVFITIVCKIFGFVNYFVSISASVIDRLTVKENVVCFSG